LADTAAGSAGAQTDTRFTQQDLPSWKPLLSAAAVSFWLFFLGIVCLVLGVFCKMSSDEVVDLRFRYDDLPQCITGDDNAARQDAMFATYGEGTACEYEVVVTKEMKAPVYLYYEMHNFYQNHRRFLGSRTQLRNRGWEKTDKEQAKCDPKRYVDMNQTLEVEPCGLAAWSFFNDTYAVYKVEDGKNDTQVTVNEKGISWAIDRDDNFADHHAKNFNMEIYKDHRGGGTIVGPINQNEHFLVWMREAAVANFWKLWGKIEEDIPAGTKLKFKIANRYNSYGYDGKKFVILSTTTWLGGKNEPLWVMTILTGIFSGAVAAYFLYVHMYHVREFADISYLSWKQDEEMKLG